MAEKQTYPWQNGDEDIASQFDFIPSPDASIQLSAYPWPMLLLTGSTLLMAVLWLTCQILLVQPAYTVGIPDALTKPPITERLEILPSPTRYDFLSAKPATNSNPEIQAGEHFPAMPSSTNSGDASLQTIAFNPPDETTVPAAPVVKLAPAPPVEPRFDLIGIAQGNDGSVATVKIAQNASIDIKDARLGEPLIPGYLVTRIEEEYILVKHQQNGKIIRVD